MEFSEILKYILLGIIQGIAEILPISSSGHLVIFQSLFGLEENKGLEVFLHVASLIAVIFYLRKTLLRLIKGFFRYALKKEQEYKYEFNYCLCLILSTCITGIIGIIVEPYMDALMQPVIVACLLLLNGGMILYMSRVKSEIDSTEMTLKHAAIIGLTQGLGVLPGISRSGATISGGVVQKIRKDDMAEYAFILFIPVTLGAMILSLDDLSLVESSKWVGYIAGFVFSLIFTYLSLKLFLKVIRKKKLDYFAYYCFTISLITLVYELFVKQ